MGEGATGLILEMQKICRTSILSLGVLLCGLGHGAYMQKHTEQGRVSMLGVKRAIEMVGADILRGKGSLEAKGANKRLRVTQNHAFLLNSCPDFRIISSVSSLSYQTTTIFLARGGLVLNLFYSLLFLANGIFSSVSQHR